VVVHSTGVHFVNLNSGLRLRRQVGEIIVGEPDGGAWVGDARRSRRRRALLAAALLALLLAPPTRAGAPDSDPRAVKADMLYNFAKFVKWPDSCFHHTQGQLVFTILGEDALAEALASTLSTRSVNGHPVFVRMVRRAADTAGSQVVYIATSEASRTPEVLRVVQGSPSLTVADTAGFVERGGMVDFSGVSDRVQFEVNQGRAERAGLKISAKLLALARVVDASP
jgi:hypothetical protein